jgi:hypothetical protein
MFRICGFTIEVPPVKVYAPTGYFLWVCHWAECLGFQIAADESKGKPSNIMCDTLVFYAQ